MRSTFLVLLFSISLSLVACSDNEGKEEDKKKYPPAATAFQDKNLVTFGNSITASKNSWAYQVQRRLGFKNLYNGALGGAIWSKRERVTSSGKTIRTQNYYDPDFAGISNGYAANPDDIEYQKRINNCAIVHIQKYLSDKNTTTPDFIILSYGTNDLSSTTVMGDADAVLREKDLNNVDLYTMAGAVRWSIETLRTKFPKVKLYVLFPIQAKSENRNNDNLKKIGVIKKICDGMSVPYFDCFAESGITQQNNEQYLGDGLHPNESGKTVHGDYVVKKLKEANK